MLQDAPTFSGFSVDDQAKAKEFYSDVLGIRVQDDEMGLRIKTANGNDVFVYAKPDHAPANFTVLNFEVKNIDEAVDGLKNKGVKFEQYGDMGGYQQDEKGILRGLNANMGPDIAWFKDPAGNILSVLQSK
jgi:catechol 2,3-dioxygenase-like lactoylglutathione lyase family enzyme